MLKIKYSLGEILEIISHIGIRGNTNHVITGICSLAKASNSDLSFLGNKKYRSQLHSTLASIVLIDKNIDIFPHENQAFLLCDNPSFSLGLLCRDIEKKYFSKKKVGIHHSAVVSESAKIGKNVYLGPNVTIEDNVEIGDNVFINAGCYVGHSAKIGNDSWLHVAVKVMDFCVVGSRTILHAGVVLGSDGFGYETVNNVHEKLPQIGNVFVGNDVEIGANTTVDRARFSSTIIGDGTKVDNLVQIGHNVEIGKCCLIVAQTGISGSTKIGDYVIIGGQSGVAGHVSIGDHSMIAGQTGVTSSCESGSFLRGSPAMPYSEANKFFVHRKNLAELVKKVKNIENKLELPE